MKKENKNTWGIYSSDRNPFFQQLFLKAKTFPKNPWDWAWAFPTYHHQYLLYYDHLMRWSEYLFISTKHSLFPHFCRGSRLLFHVSFTMFCNCDLAILQNFNLSLCNWIKQRILKKHMWFLVQTFHIMWGLNPQHQTKINSDARGSIWSLTKTC